jgi:hypothetical protein
MTGVKDRKETDCVPLTPGKCDRVKAKKTAAVQGIVGIQ